jgi:hypothetical protein
MLGHLAFAVASDSCYRNYAVLVHLKETKEKKKVRVEIFSSCYLGFGFCKIASTNIQFLKYLFQLFNRLSKRLQNAVAIKTKPFQIWKGKGLFCAVALS